MKILGIMAISGIACAFTMAGMSSGAAQSVAKHLFSVQLSPCREARTGHPTGPPVDTPRRRDHDLLARALVEQNPDDNCKTPTKLGIRPGKRGLFRALAAEPRRITGIGCPPPAQ